MNNLQNLLDRIDAETSVQKERQKRLQQERVEAFEKRTRRYHDLFLPAFGRLNKIWIPRMQILADKLHFISQNFGETVKVTSEIRPSPVEPHSGETIFVFESSPARIRLKLGFYHDVNFDNMILDYDLEIIPVFLKFEAKSRLELTVATFDENSAAQWLDDRIVAFVRTYLAIHENPTYVADQMVEDPIAQVRFPRFAAESTVQKNGSTFYFISPETKRKFENESRLSTKSIASLSGGSSAEHDRVACRTL